MNCRHCGQQVTLRFIDLQTAPPSNSYLSAEQLAAPEKWYPLRVSTCTNCWLVQTEDYAQRGELFSEDYAYFSSYSTSWLQHAEAYVEAMAERLRLGPHSQVVEVAANDGYLLQYVQARSIPCLGVEPTASTARAARAKGLAVAEEFFDLALAERLVEGGNAADLTVANNVLAHVPDINGFVRGFARLLKPGGVATFEFPHLLQLVANGQFDTIYHEHFSYLSLTAVRTIFEAGGLSIFDVEEIPTHGGSLRIFAQRPDTMQWPVNASVSQMLMREHRAGVKTPAYYSDFQKRADMIKDRFVEFLIEAKRDGKRVAAYGAAAKGNTLLNYSGVRSDLIAWVADRNPAKKGRYLPGSRIPIVDESLLGDQKPDFIVILPWNLASEIMEQLSYAARWGGKFVTAVPELVIQ